MEIAQLLIAKGAKVNEPNKEGRTALNILCDADIFMDMENRLSFASLLLTNGANKEFQSNEHMTSGGTSLMNAASNGYYELAKLLLDKGSNPNAQNDGGEGWPARSMENAARWTRASASDARLNRG